ncbi:MAG: ankyrin repeat domain-containing protein, partial [Candidatus Micrarchaeia archaeon]
MTEQNKKLLEAVSSGDLAGVKEALAAGADVNAKDRDGYTALMVASYWGHMDIVKLLIAAGADVNAKSETGYTALIEA